MRALGKSFDRLRELNRGRIDVYDHITADNLRPLVQAGRLILQRDPFSILYLGMNLEHPIMGRPEVREAIARSVRRSALSEAILLEGSRPAFQFTPPALGVHSDAAPRYDRSPTAAAELLEEAGYEGEPLRFYYPMATTRSWLPRPEAVYASLARDLTDVGLVIEPRPVRWDDGYIEEMLADDERALHLMGRNGGFRSPHSFFGPLFGQNGLGMPNREFNYDSEEVWELMAQARGEQDDEARAELYRELAVVLAEDLPAVPLAYPISGLALGRRVSDYPMSPVLNEQFARHRARRRTLNLEPAESQVRSRRRNTDHFPRITQTTSKGSTVNQSAATPEASGPENRYDVILIGAGIMSTTLGSLLSELEPHWSIGLFEKLEGAARSPRTRGTTPSTGHAALCELNYTPQGKDGSVSTAKAKGINEQFHVSRQLWSHWVQNGTLEDPAPSSTLCRTSASSGATRTRSTSRSDTRR